VQLGVFILARPRPGPSGPSLQPFVDMVRQAESYGFARIVTGDSQLNNLECFSALTLMATLTERCRIGPQVTNPVTRDVGVMAAALGSLDLISNGRALWIVGRGDGGVRNAGLKPATVAELSDYFRAVRELFDRGETCFRGRTVHYLWPSYWPGGEQRRIPLHMVAEGPRMLELAGAMADGVLIGAGLTPEVVRDSLAHLAAGARSTGRDPDEIEVWWSTRCSIAEGSEEALERGKESLSSAGNHALRGALEQKLVPEHLIEPIRAYHRRYDYSQKGQSSGGNALLMEELGLTGYFNERFGLIGSPAQIVERLEYLATLGVRNVSVQANIRFPESLALLGERVLPRLPRD
jgi:5,10-methylenetetrahydromethanopterin reductase